MKKVLLFGSTGNLGRKIGAELLQQGYDVTAVVRNEVKANEAKNIAHHIIIADVTKTASLSGICDAFPIVISALGKSVSPNDKSKASFHQIDFETNLAILNEAVRSGVKKFVYISALGAENYPQLNYFNAHHRFSEKLKSSGIDYAIIKPPALFSAFVDLIDLAKKGRLVTFGRGDKLTNPIYEGDLATICVVAIAQPKVVLEAGGKDVLSRRQINELIQSYAAPDKKVRTLPIGFVNTLLLILRFTSKNLYDKMSFFLEVTQHDTLAPSLGETTLTSYLQQQLWRKPTETTIGG